MAEPILTIGDLAPQRPIVRISGVNYEMRMLTEFSAIRRQRLINTWDRVRDITKRVRAGEAISEDEADVAEDGYRWLARSAMPDVPMEIWNKLDMPEVETLVLHFLALTAKSGQATITSTEPETMAPSTSET